MFAGWLWATVGDPYGKARPLVRNYLRYLCGDKTVNGNHLITISKVCGLHKEFTALKKKFLKWNDYVLTRMWRAIMTHLLGTDMVSACRRYRIVHSDMLLAMRVLTDEDKQAIRDIAAHGTLTAMVPNVIVEEIVDQLKRFVSMLAFEKARFLVDYDSMYDSLTDVHNECYCEIVRLCRTYDRFDADIATDHAKYNGNKYIPKNGPWFEIVDVVSDGKSVPFTIRKRHVVVAVERGTWISVTYRHYLKMANYARRGVANFVNGLIYYHSHKCRRRLCQTPDGYAATVITMDEDGGMPPVDIDTHKLVASKMFVDKITTALTTKQLALVHIISGNPTEGFEVWLQKEKGSDYDSLTDRELTEFGSEYLDLNYDDMDNISRSVVAYSGDIPLVDLQTYLDAYLELDTIRELKWMGTAEIVALHSEVIQYGEHILGLDTRSLEAFGHLFVKLLWRAHTSRSTIFNHKVASRLMPTEDEVLLYLHNEGVTRHPNTTLDTDDYLDTTYADLV